MVDLASQDKASTFAFNTPVDFWNEIDRRIATSQAIAIQSIKLWVLISVVTTLVVSIGGGIGAVYYLGQISNQFQVAMELNVAQSQVLTRRGLWMERKDTIDDELIRFLGPYGYAPPAWYNGKDSQAIEIEK